MTLTGVIKIFDDISAAMPDEYGHCKAMANHIRKVANTGVRNIGTLAGNLMLKHAHPDFASDLYTLLAAARAAAVIRSSSGIVEVPMEAFLAENLDRVRKVFFKLSVWVNFKWTTHVPGIANVESKRSLKFGSACTI